MKPKWLIQQYHADKLTSLIEALDRQGIEWKMVKHQHSLSHDKSYLKLFDEDDCVIFFGCLEFAKMLQKEAKWIPGVYYNIPAFECVGYYPALGKYLLNQNYIMIPYGDMMRQKEFLFERVGQDRTIFVRPDRGNKPFTGKLIYKEHFAKDIDLLGYSQLDPSSLMIVAEPVNITGEWRFVACEKKIIAGSQYRRNGLIWIEGTWPQEAFDLASEVANAYNPDPVWCIDVCSTSSGEFRIVEVGCFSCAGLYDANRDHVVEHVSAAALREWESYRE